MYLPHFDEKGIVDMRWAKVSISIARYMKCEQFIIDGRSKEGLVERGNGDPWRVIIWIIVDDTANNWTDPERDHSNDSIMPWLVRDHIIWSIDSFRLIAGNQQITVHDWIKGPFTQLRSRAAIDGRIVLKPEHFQ